MIKQIIREESSLEPALVEEAFRHVVESRRSVRKFDGAPVPEAVVRECLRLAMLAPTSSNLQSWQFIWVRTPALKQRLVPVCMGQQAARTAGELIAVVARTGTWRRNARPPR